MMTFAPYVGEGTDLRVGWGGKRMRRESQARVAGGRCTYAESSARPLRQSCRHALNTRSIPDCNPCNLIYL
ncbi:unnamed protein product [Pieris macdunnoughi]|uniref:Uncharacterized protein n=1 Tax=Pieris macdunnoughi TaxID=345717 RepID=A0A821MPF8_9NEOP|nr:unnamed protein product [Pieris macdunnoughi]